MSADRSQGLAIIIFVGSVFSPYYAWSGRSDPEAHCAVNIALYRPGKHLWAMTERGRADLVRDPNCIGIGASSACWEGSALHVHVDEWTAPLPSRLRGAVIVRPTSLFGDAYALDREQKHRWRPIAPNADIDVSFTEPKLAWKGRAYLDCNWGAEPPERAFKAWDWSRAHAGETTVNYDVCLRDGSTRATALRFGAAGNVEQAPVPPAITQLPPTLWRLTRRVRCGDEGVGLVRTLEDTPFYARSWLRTRCRGVEADIFHESLSLTRLTSPLVRAMLPFRMPRIARR